MSHSKLWILFSIFKRQIKVLNVSSNCHHLSLISYRSNEDKIFRTVFTFINDFRRRKNWGRSCKNYITNFKEILFLAKEKQLDSYFLRNAQFWVVLVKCYKINTLSTSIGLNGNTISYKYTNKLLQIKCYKKIFVRHFLTNEEFAQRHTQKFADR